jgi:hypothetical protein
MWYIYLPPGLIQKVVEIPLIFKIRNQVVQIVTTWLERGKAGSMYSCHWVLET